jgi:hypothetical protein
MTDEEIVDKFTSMASRYMSDEYVKQVIDTVFELDKLGDIGKLNRLMVFRDR